MYRAAVVGCGRVGSELGGDAPALGVATHCGAYRACSDTNLVAVCDLDPDRLTRCGDRWQVAHRYTDLGELLAEQRPEIVSLCTPDGTHVPLMRQILRSRSVRGVLLEKPIARTVEEAHKVVALAESRRVVISVNYSRRFAPSHIALRDWIAAGGLGRLQLVNGYYGNGLLHNGTHWLDMARYLAGEVRHVRAWDTLREEGPDPTLDVELGFVSGGRGHLLGVSDRYFTIFEMDLVGTKGRVRVLDFGHGLEAFGVGDSPRYTGYRELVRAGASLTGGLQDVLLHAVTDLVGCLDAGGQPRCTGRDALAALAIAIAARSSAADGRLHRPPV